MLSPSGVTQARGMTPAKAAAKETKLHGVPWQKWFKPILFFSKICREGYCKTSVGVDVMVCSSYYLYIKLKHNFFFAHLQSSFENT